MANPENRTPPPPPGRSLLETLAVHRQESAIGLFVSAGIIAAVVGWRFLATGLDNPGLKIMGVVLALIPVLAGIWQLAREPGGERLSEVEHSRLMVLSLGAAVGLWLTVFSVFLVVAWWEETFSLGIEQWRTDWVHVAVPLGCLLGGLVLMFASLQLGRVEERSSSLMRRTLYGYNAVLSGILLLVILGLINVMAYVRAGPLNRLSETSDWTASSLYTLSDSTKNLLRHLPQPVKIYVLRTGFRNLDDDVKRLMDNCKVYAPAEKFEVQYMFPEADPRGFERLYKEYRDKCRDMEIEGLLVVFGTEANQRCGFIRVQELGTRNMRGGAFDDFEGEIALASRLGKLIENEKPPRLYFTQGNGEYDLNSREIGAGKAPGLGMLKQQLEAANYQVLPIRFGEGQKSVPAEADAVVVVRPKAFAPEGITALREYLNKAGSAKNKGRLIICFEALGDPSGKMIRTGLEDLVREFNVELGDGEVLTFPNGMTPEPFVVPVIGDPESKNVLARNLFGSDTSTVPLWFPNTRRIQGKPPAPGTAAGPYRAENLLYALGQIEGVRWGVYEESDLREDVAEARFRKLRQSASRDERVQLLKERIPVAAVVTESGGPEEGGMGESTPRMAVFGSADWLANELMRPGLPLPHYTLFTNTVKWLRGRPDIGPEPQPKTRRTFVIEKPEIASRLIWVPAPLVLLGILGLGGGIWLVRRR